ncbi:MAG: surface carbohydrate biosynthesis protein [Vicinamibacterales bacterium]
MKLGPDRPTVLFSVETAARELDSKLVMACALAERGCRSIVGHKEAVTEIARSSRRVVWQGKSLFSVRSDNHLADRLIENGSAVVFITDEGAMHQADSWVEQTLHKHWTDHFRTRRVHRMCVWGARQGEVVSAHLPALRGRISVTGSARFDLCSPDYSWLSREPNAATGFGDDGFILACTRFSALAHSKGMAAPFQIKLNRNAWPASISTEEVTDVWFKKWRQDAHDFAEFVVLVKEMARGYPKLTVVIRPHPSESTEFYQQAFATVRNVTVRREGNVLDWIRPARVVVHSNSTSGVEAVLARRPVVNFLPSSSDRDGLDVEVAREAGVTAGSVAEALGHVDRLLSGDAFTHEWSDDARSMLNNLNEAAVPLLVKQTLEALDEETIDSSSVTLPGGGGLRANVRRVLKRTEDRYLTSKRGRLSSEYVETVVAGCRSRGIGAARVRQMTDRYVVIEPV